jgi:DNA-binding transcriptional ArsR family regulator
MATLMNDLDEIERLFLALSDKTRIRLVGLMRNGEVTVNYLCESVGESQPKVSRHLAYLRMMGLVTFRRDGKWVYYRLAEPKSRLGSRVLVDTLAWIEASVHGGGAVISEAESNLFAPDFHTLSASSSRVDIYGDTDMTNRSEELEIYLL